MQRRSKNQRNVHGILLLNKPLKLTSNHALQKVKHLFQARKAGHTGSLDPLATGMLPICFGEATKFSQFLLDADKRYRVTALLGKKTTTADAEGEVIAENPVPELSIVELENILEKFRGDIWQTPSMYSALKHEGRPLYELARKGMTIERPARQITINELSLLEKTATTLAMEVACSKGTYIRNLVEDIGDVLGCGAHVIELHRLSVANYSAEKMLTLEMLQQLSAAENFSALDELLLPIDTALYHMPAVNLPENMLFFIKRGQSVLLPNATHQGVVKILSQNNEFIGIGEIVAGNKLEARRLISTSLPTN